MAKEQKIVWTPETMARAKWDKLNADAEKRDEHFKRLKRGNARYWRERRRKKAVQD